MAHEQLTILTATPLVPVVLLSSGQTVIDQERLQRLVVRLVEFIEADPPEIAGSCMAQTLRHLSELLDQLTSPGACALLLDRLPEALAALPEGESSALRALLADLPAVILGPEVPDPKTAISLAAWNLITQ